MTADPCIASDFDPRPDDGTFMDATGLWLIPRCYYTGPPGIRHHDLVLDHHRTTHCPQLGLPFSKLPMCQ